MLIRICLIFGEKTIFPVILWQVYFIVGILFGEKNILSLSGMKKNIKKLLFVGLAVFIFSVTVKYADNFIPVLGKLTNTKFFRGSKFPLDTLGLLYHGALLVLCYCCIYISWNWINKLECVKYFFEEFGRHSLLAFVIHVYFCFLLKVITYFSVVHFSLAIGVILANIIFSLFYFHVLEKRTFPKFSL